MTIPWLIKNKIISDLIAWLPPTTVALWLFYKERDGWIPLTLIATGYMITWVPIWKKLSIKTK